MVFIASLPFGGTLSLLLGQAPGASIEQQLQSQYRISSVDNSGVVVGAGTILVVAQNGIKAGPPSTICWSNSHKPGSQIKYSMSDSLLVPVDLKNQARLLQVGEKVILLRIGVKSSQVEFCVQTPVDAVNTVPYRACVVFQFPQKNYVQPANLKAIQDSIAEVFSLDQPPPPPQKAATINSFTAEPSTIARGETSTLRWLVSDSTSVTIDNGIGTVSATGSSSVRPTDNATYHVTAAGAGGEVAAAVTVYVTKPPEPLPPLPVTYANSKSPADQIQLNADNSFSLQESGQPYHGTFVRNGNTLTLTISDTGTTTPMTIQGGGLIDANGGTWTVRPPSATPPPLPPAARHGDSIKNEDIIKMVKAGIDGATIIAKIGSSKCQFDTSTDALIKLKQSGVSAAVLKAMVGAGKK
jgi:hypothetical protein